MMRETCKRVAFRSNRKRRDALFCRCAAEEIRTAKSSGLPAGIHFTACTPRLRCLHFFPTQDVYTPDRLRKWKLVLAAIGKASRNNYIRNQYTHLDATHSTLH